MILCIDLETSGLSQINCGLFEIGACWLDGSGDFFRACRPQHGAIIEKAALEVNGRTEEDAKDLSRLPEALAISEFTGWARGWHAGNKSIQIAAWNAHFDHRHLVAALDRAGIDHRHRPFTHRLLDLHSMLAGDLLRKKCQPSSSRPENYLSTLGNEVANSDEAAKLYDLAPEPKPHNALTGAKQVRALLRRFLGDAGALP